MHPRGAPAVGGAARVSLSLADGYRALRDEAAGVWLARDAVRIAGPDAMSFADGQLSQDIAVLEVGHCAWSFVLEPQGKVDALVRVTRVEPDVLVLDTDAGWGDSVAERLRRFKLRVKADVEPVEWQVLAVRGPGPVGSPDAAFVSPPLAGTGSDLVGPSVTPPSGLPLVGLDAFEVLRIEDGVPAMGSELNERTIPAEAGIVDRTVSFTKGCFTGQELVARIDSRGGNVPRHLHGVVAETLAVGQALTIDGRDAGTVTSVARHPGGHMVGLAYVRRDVSPPADAVADGAGVARILPLPLVS